MKRPPELSMLGAIYDRWQRMETDRRILSVDLKELFAEGKANGFNAKALRKAFAEKFRMENEDADKASKRQETDADVELYLTALARVHVRDAA
jgi:uncharacterized protein (UPF0335 family)